jgi:hypothetical protein
MELFVGAELVGVEHEFAEAVEDGGAGIVDALRGDGGRDRGHGVLDIGFGETFFEERFYFALKIIDTGTAGTHGAVVVAESVVAGMSGLGAAASVGVGAAAERSVGRIGAPTRHLI